MKKETILNTMVILGIGFITPFTAYSADKSSMAMDQNAMMAQMQKYGMPGPNHQALMQAAGKWTHTIKSWMKPGDKPMESKGTSENTMVLGGRFLEQKAHGDMNGMPFEGLGYTGYDNVGGQYQSVWMDNMTTGMMTGSGSADPTTQVIKETGQFSCPITMDKAKWYRSEWKTIDVGTQVYTMYFKDDTGKEFKSMEITYKRAK